MTDIVMPRLSDTMEEGVLSRWLKKPGDTIAKGDVLAEIETDKAMMDLESFESGVLEQLLVAEGTTVPIGQAVAIVGDGSNVDESIPAAGAGTTETQADAAEPRGDEAGPDEDAAGPEGDAAEPGGDAPEPGGDAPEPAEDAATTRDADGTAESADAEKTATSGESAPADGASSESGEQDPSASRAGRIVISPLARKLAREGGVDVAELAGTGPGGRIVRADVEDAIAEQAEAAEEPAPETKASPAKKASRGKPADGESPQDERVKLSNIRKITAKRLTESQAVPHFFLTSQVDAKRLLKMRSDINKQAEPDGIRISVNDLIVRAVALTLRNHPEVNASFDTDAVILRGRVNVGIAVAIDDGLIVPVIHDADQKSLREISVETVELATRAREGRLKLDEITGGTFSVSNLGMFGIEQFTAVINPPEAGILAVGAAIDHPVVKGDKLVNVPRFSITMTADHRAFDGATAAAFVRDLTELLQNPMRLVV